ncbi:hypothetical protein Emed_001243 [Eimeria media]
MRWRRPGRRRLLLGLAIAALAAAFVLGILDPSAAAAATDTADAEVGWLRRVSRKFAGMFRSRKSKKTSSPGAASLETQATVHGGVQPAGVGGGVQPTQQAVTTIADPRTAKADSQGTEKPQAPLRGRQAAAESTRVVWQSLALPHYRTSRVQDVLEHWHMEAATHLLDSYHIQELLRTYMTVLEWGIKLFLPDLTEVARGHISNLTAIALDVDVCTKRLLYLSGVPIVMSRGADSQDIDFRKTKVLHALGVFYVLQGRLMQLSSLMRESSKLLCKELMRRHPLTPQMAKVLMPFTRLARYSLDALDYLTDYYRGLRAAIVGSIVHPLFVTRTYSRLHVSLQTIGQFFATCGHARKIGESLQRDIVELRGAGGGMNWNSPSQVWDHSVTESSRLPNGAPTLP